jgi:hypothetical protein
MPGRYPGDSVMARLAHDTGREEPARNALRWPDEGKGAGRVPRCPPVARHVPGVDRDVSTAAVIPDPTASTRRSVPDRYAELLCRIHPVGTPGDCARIMTATVRRTGIRHLICMVEGAGDRAAVQENIARLGAEVLPLLAGRVSSPPAPGAG